MRKGWWVPLTGAANLFAILAATPAWPIGFFGAALWVIVISDPTGDALPRTCRLLEGQLRSRNFVRAATCKLEGSRGRSRVWRAAGESASSRNWKESAMTEAEPRPAIATYRGAVKEVVQSGAPFGDIEEAIDQLADLSIDEKAALWLLAFSLRDPAGHQLDARTAATCVLTSAGAK